MTSVWAQWRTILHRPNVVEDFLWGSAKPSYKWFNTPILWVGIAYRSKIRQNILCRRHPFGKVPSGGVQGWVLLKENCFGVSLVSWWYPDGSASGLFIEYYICNRHYRYIIAKEFYILTTHCTVEKKAPSGSVSVVFLKPVSVWNQRSQVLGP
jgi:hypothetical protein